MVFSNIVISEADDEFEPEENSYADNYEMDKRQVQKKLWTKFHYWIASFTMILVGAYDVLFYLSVSGVKTVSCCNVLAGSVCAYGHGETKKCWLL